MSGTTREAILEALRALLASAAAEGFFPEAKIDEPDPSGWEDIAETSPRLKHACAVQDGPPPDAVAFVRGDEDTACEELELEAAIAYVVVGSPDAGQTSAEVRGARRARRDAAVLKISGLIALDRTLGLNAEVYADVRPAQRDDDVAFPNAEPGAVAIVPIRVLYTAASAAL